ncbi:MAG: ThiF family adenylyltransferase [Candidatus Izimaplasma sp.]|nr:ThiF family adenylyltransferase [Candidatus Izimaplasma bacterium]
MKFNRLENLIGEDKLKLLANKKVVVFGLGGVGSFAAEALIRSNILDLVIVDYDLVDISNINRQLIALETTIGLKKTEVFRNRAISINSNANVEIFNYKVDKSNIDEILFEKPDFVLDCIDDVEAKVLLAKECYDRDIPIILAMGFANKFHPEKIKISILKNTSVCPLAKVMRKKIRDIGLPLDIPVVFSEETPSQVIDPNVLGSTAYCPSTAGLIMASYVINKFIESGD